jgi:hypothetical protein
VQAIERTAPGYTRYLTARVRGTVIPRSDPATNVIPSWRRGREIAR